MNELAAARHTRDVGHDIIAKDETTREDIPKHTIEDVVHEVLELPYSQTEYLNSVRNRIKVQQSVFGFNLPKSSSTADLFGIECDLFAMP